MTIDEYLEKNPKSEYPFPVIIFLLAIGLFIWGSVTLVKKSHEKEPLGKYENRIEILYDHEKRITYLEQNCIIREEIEK